MATPWDALRYLLEPQPVMAAERDPASMGSKLTTPAQAAARGGIGQVNPPGMVDAMTQAAGGLASKLPGFSKDSGRKAGVTIDNNSKQLVNATEATWPDPENIAKLTTVLEGGDVEEPNPLYPGTTIKTHYNGIPAIVAQKQGQQQMDNMLSMELGKPIDSSAIWARGLANLSDSLYGTKLLQGAPADPLAPESKARLMNYLDKAQDNRRDYASKLIDAVKALKSGNTQEQYIQNMLTKLTGSTGNFPKTGANTDVNNYYKWLNFSKSQLQDSDKRVSMAGQLLTMVDNPNALNDSRIPTIMASLDEHGRPNYAVIQADTGSKAIADKIEQAYQTLKTGEFTDKNRQLVKDAIQTIVDYENKHRQMLSARMKQVGLQTGLSQGKIDANLPEAYVNPIGTSKTQPKVDDKTKQTQDLMKQIQDLKKMKQELDK